MVGDSTNDPSGASLSYRNIIEREMEDSLREIERPSTGVFLSAFTAGLNLSFGVLFMAMVLTFAGGFESRLAQQLALGGISAIPFLFVVVGQTELFTAHSTMAVLPYLDGRTTLAAVGRLWGTTYVGNLVGCVFFAGFLAVLGPAMNVVEPASVGSLANALVPFSAWVIFLSGIVAGWLMGLATWLSAASRDTIGRIVFVLLVTALIGFGPFHHSILGTTEVLSALFLGQDILIGDYVHFLVWTTLGNVVGGSVFVGLLNYGHVALAGDPQNVAFENERESR